MGRITRLAGRSVCPSVRLSSATTLEAQPRSKLKMSANVFQGRSKQCANFNWIKSIIQDVRDGRMTCRHEACMSACYRAFHGRRTRLQ